jgi:hypothetical protein
MKKKLVMGVIAAVVPVLAIVGFAAAGGDQSSLSDLRNATAEYHDVAAALAEPGAVELPQVEPFGTGTCIQNLSGPGAMGIHILIQSRVDDKLVPTEPEAILYEKRNDGTLKLTGVEYVVASADRPTLYGQQFDQTNLARYGNPAATVWTLHVWAWKPNPDPERGLFAPWNTRVSCD